MKHKFNFATWWRHFSGQSIKIAFSTPNIAPPGGEINFFFHRAKRGPLYHMYTKLDIFILVVSRRSFESTKKRP